MERIFCFDQKVDGDLLMSGRASELSMEKWDLFQGKLMNSHFKIYDNVAYTEKELDEVFAYLNMEKIRSKTDNVLLVFDHVQMCSLGGFRNRYEALSNYTRNLKVAATRYDIPIIVTSQVNREGVGGMGLEHLKGSGEIEEAADVVWLCRYPIRIDASHHLEREKQHMKMYPDDPHYYTVMVEKNRNGKCGFAELYYEPSSFFFRERRSDE
jgi:replicative DNA helicase